MKGDISSLHSYHRHRVSDEDRAPFGRLVGIGTITVGAAVGVSGILFAVAERLSSEALIWVGTAILIVGIVAGLGTSFYAMFKYNKGIF